MANKQKIIKSTLLILASFACLAFALCLVPRPGKDFDIHRLENASSLKMIYTHATRMRPSSLEDMQKLSPIVENHLNSCCTNYEEILEEVKSAKFTEIIDVTKASKERENFLGEDTEYYDELLYSTKTSGLKFDGFLPFVYQYKIYLYFKQKKLIKVKTTMYQFSWPA